MATLSKEAEKNKWKENTPANKQASQQKDNP